MSENEIVTIILDVAFEIHRRLGPGLLESVYQAIMEYELKYTYKLSVIREPKVPVIWKDLKMDLGFRSDLLVEGKVLVELKSVEALHPVHPKILFTHLKLLNLKLGILINFNVDLLKNGIKRVVNNL